MATMLHRGPDEGGIWSDGEITLGMRRLAIIDPKNGHQPCFDERERIVAVANAEFYGFQKIASQLRARGHRTRSDSDVELLPHLYEEHRDQMWAKLPGMFAAAVFDRDERRLLVARDRIGKKPLFYSNPSFGVFLFASELKALRSLHRSLGYKCEKSDQAIYDFLSLGYVPGPQTIYKGIRAVRPGHFLHFDGSRAVESAYWELRETGGLPLAGDLESEVRRLVRSAVETRLVADVPIGLFLSGGVDSTIVAIEASALGASPTAFTATFGVPEWDESAVAAKTASALGLRHKVVPVQLEPARLLHRVVAHFDQPFADSSAIPSLAVAEAASHEVKVILNGDGGDEVFLGYRRYLASQWADRLAPKTNSSLAAKLSDLLASRFRRRSGIGFALRNVRGLLRSPESRRLVWLSDMLLEGEKQAAWLRGHCRPTEEFVHEAVGGFTSDLSQQRAFDLFVNLPWDLLVKVDMACMAASIEPRSPFLDQAVVEFAFRISPNEHVRRGVGKALLRRAYGSQLPTDVLHGPKRGFEVPLEQWLTGEFSGLINDSVLARDSRIANFIERSTLKSIIERIRSAEKNGPYLVYALLVAELWLRDEENS